jgi:hypothetical protein
VNAANTPRALAIAALAVAGCAHYAARSFVAADGTRFAGDTLTLGCLDVGIAVTADVLAHGPVIDYRFANRCDHPAIVDLASIRAVGRAADGGALALVAFDPHHELRPLALDSGGEGHELIEYDGRDVRLELPDRDCALMRAAEADLAALLHQPVPPATACPSAPVIDPARALVAICVEVGGLDPAHASPRAVCPAAM